MGTELRATFGLPGLAFALLALAGCVTTGARPAPDAGTTPAPLAAYVLLGESPAGGPVALARVILTSGRACPRLVAADGRAPASLPMVKRLNPHGFTVDVCEAVLPFDREYALGPGGATLPVARRHVERVAVFGDTGCKPKDQAGCGLDDPAWPFPALTRAAAGRQPDLVLHVGDYNYRGTPSSFEQTAGGQSVKQWYYDAGDGAEPSEQCELPGPYYSQNSTGNPDRDAWPAWWLDFFQPAAELLAASPWVFARGNHELCSHAGPGWFYFLDASSELPEGGGAQLACPSQDGEGPALPHLVMIPPRVVALQDLSVAVLDSANACDGLNNFGPQYDEQFGAIAGRLADGTAWLIGHRPVWGVEGSASGPAYGCDGEPGSGPTPAYGVLNRTLQCALAGTGGQALLPKLDLLLAGHMHRFEWLVFNQSTGRPPSLIVGNGGVQEDTEPPQGAFQQAVDGTQASGFSVEEFGFLELARDAKGRWLGTVLTPDPGAWAPSLQPCPARAGEPPLCVEGLPGRGGATLSTHH
ncbi:MAG TPA: metallophosphoesterase [Thermoanaerobaculia bacterium]|nr:metallophosphoesterase [Thermoanaerobaculia bacterium]